MTILTNQKYITEAGGLPSQTGLLCDQCDKEDFTKEELTEHFKNIHALFVGKIGALKSSFHVLTIDEEKELHFILDALLQSKQLLQDSE